MSAHIFGIRHHGPGSARSLRAALEVLRPDAVLVEGPPDADSLLPLLTHEAMRPPIALLLYAPDEPQRAVFYPFAIFSPEWQALHYALRNGIAVRFMDLPQTHQLAFDPTTSDQKSEIQFDPLQRLAEAAGDDDGERWWEQMVEHRRDGKDLFAAINEAMTSLRSTLPPSENKRETLREAFMRQTIRAAQREGFERIAVVCGAWHAPALDVEATKAKYDATVLKGLPKTKIVTTWTPWTHSRLATESGYGAGIESPGWYQHLWTAPDATVIRWMARVAALLREADLDVSPAHVIEAVRLAETLAALRGRPLPGLGELNDATQTVICFGDDVPLQLIREKLIVGETLGQVPDETPMSPLQQDLQREQKRLRLKPEASQRTLDLDLRNATDLDRSRLLHRLTLLGVAWGEAQVATGKGTFHELWRLRWQPELVINLIETSVWGNTISDAATAFACHNANQAKALPALTTLTNQVLLADLPAAMAQVMAQLQAMAAVTSDVAHLMEALPPLANIERYGNVRQTDATMVSEVVNGLATRICIGLPGACASLNEEAATQMFESVVNVNGAFALLQRDDLTTNWHHTLKQMTDQMGLHGLLAGRCCRLLLDAAAIPHNEAAQRLRLALSLANEPTHAAAWIEGFLKGSGTLLLHDDALWQALDDWMAQLAGENFAGLLPLLRRTFATFTAPERRKMGERAKRAASPPSRNLPSNDEAFDHKTALTALPFAAKLLGLSYDG